METKYAFDLLLCIPAGLMILPVALIGLGRAGLWIISKTGPRFISPQGSGESIDTKKAKK